MANGTTVFWRAQSRMKRRKTGLHAALAFLVAGTIAWSQFKPANPEQQRPLEPLPQKTGEQPTFSIKVNLVRLLVSVRDPAGGVVTNLDKNDFRIFDSGRLQDIAVFERHTSLPLSLAILIDTSGSTEKDLRFEEDSVLRFLPTFLDAGNSADTFALFSFNWRTNLEVDYSRSQRRAERALRALHGEGGTSLYDAVFLACDTLDGRDGRHVMVLVTDGGDTTSYKKYPDALAAAQRADVVLYPIVVVPIANDAGRNLGGEHALATMAESTGGRIFYPDNYDRLNTAFSEIMEELRTQYLIGFYPKDVPQEPRRFHPISVQLANTALKISARTGYYEP
jgi:Ca-activated chloride channel homolog